ncbi:hypothetical protein HD554DRAFT_1058173 [Boletus coccyginus]|nr:hypothetical protein HD554DRAFT_1058173 [Boletus coccyginus]
MAFPDFSFFRELVRSLRINSGDESTVSVELARELEDLRKIALNLVMAFLTVHTISGSHALGATTLALLIYTINLHIAVNARFLQNSPILSISLHIIPLLGIFCIAVFNLVIVVQSPAVAAAVLLACVLPPLIVAVHLAKRYAEVILMSLPV